MDLCNQPQHALGSSCGLERELGRDGMSTVYLAEDLKHDRKVPVKVVGPELAAALDAARFTSAIRVAARLQHPHILPRLGTDHTESFLYYVTPYVEGQRLHDRLGHQGELPMQGTVLAPGRDHRRTCLRPGRAGGARQHDLLRAGEVPE
jgi:eukaryotic-like serine/threonine-protein kinase